MAPRPAGGGLIILPKKSWNPWKRENVERVTRDERLDAERRDREASEQRRVDQEVRVEALRERRASRSDDASRSSAPKRRRLGTAALAVARPAAPAPAAVAATRTTGAAVPVLFAEPATSARVRRAEEDRLKAKAALVAKHQEQRRLGIAPLGLGQSSTKLEQRWWNRPAPRAAAAASASASASASAAVSTLTVKESDWRGRPLRGAAAVRAVARCERMKARLDPMAAVAAALERDAAPLSAPLPIPLPVPLHLPPAAQGETSKKPKKSSKKKKKKKKKKTTKTSPPAASALETLRAQRLQREKRERARTVALLASKARAGGIAEARWSREHVYGGFHPELARQNQ